MSCPSEAEIEIIPSRIEPTTFCITFQCCTTAPYLLSYDFTYSTIPDMDGDYSWRKVYCTGRLKTLCTMPPPPPPQHTEAQFKVPDWGDKVDFTALLLFWHFFIVFFHCWYTALKGEYFSLFILLLVTFYWLWSLKVRNVKKLFI